MLSKFQTNNKTKEKKFPRRAVANLLMKEVERKKVIFPSAGNIKAENSPKDQQKKIKWQMNPLYKAKFSKTDESESESITSLSLRQSYLYSEQSVNSGYKSNNEDGTEFQENIFEKVNIRKIATELLETMKGLDSGMEDNESMKKALEECEHELEKVINIRKYSKIC